MTVMNLSIVWTAPGTINSESVSIKECTKKAFDWRCLTKLWQLFHNPKLVCRINSRFKIALYPDALFVAVAPNELFFRPMRRPAANQGLAFGKDLRKRRSLGLWPEEGPTSDRAKRWKLLSDHAWWHLLMHEDCGLIVWHWNARGPNDVNSQITATWWIRNNGFGIFPPPPTQ